MCGIVAIYDIRGEGRVDQLVLERMLDRLAHRGPDDRSVYLTPNTGLGFTRLSIVDVERGRQPLANEDGSIVGVCAGEIFNYRSHREQLVRRGHRFVTDSDSEVVLHLYEECGQALVNELNGQFAFVIVDLKQDSVFAARDHFGITPLFYAVADDLLLVASEIKALIAHPAICAEVDPIGLHQLFAFSSVISPRTLFKGISSLPNGHHLSGHAGSVSVREYWDLVYPSADGETVTSAQDAAEELDHLLTKSVQRRLQGDVPVGIYVSGGLDSALLAAKLHALDPFDRRHSFSVIFDDVSLTEARYQRRVARDIQSVHHEVLVSDEVILENLRDVVFYSETPLRETYNTAALALSREARLAGIKVCLTGQGADELFAGYVGYKFDRLRSSGQGVAPVTEQEAEIRRLVWGDPNFFYEKSFEALLQTTRGLYSDQVNCELGEFGCLDKPAVNLERLSDVHPLHRRAYVDYKLRLANHLLADHGDRMSYANSVELRHPFLDLDIANFATRLSPDLKLNRFEEKYILRRVAQSSVPPEIMQREKFPLATPGSAALLKSDRSGYVRDLLAPARIRADGYFNPAAVDELRQRYEHPDFVIDPKVEDDYLTMIVTFGIFREAFELPALGA